MHWGARSWVTQSFPFLLVTEGPGFGEGFQFLITLHWSVLGNAHPANQATPFL